MANGLQITDYGNANTYGKLIHKCRGKHDRIAWSYKYRKWNKIYKKLNYSYRKIEQVLVKHQTQYIFIINIYIQQ